MSFEGPPGLHTAVGGMMPAVRSNGAAEAFQGREKLMHPTIIPIVARNPALVVTRLDLAVPPVTSKHFDLIASTKSSKTVMSNSTNAELNDAGKVTTLCKSKGEVLDLVFSPHFESFVSIVNAAGEAFVQDITQSRATFKVVPAKTEGPVSFLKSCWHPSKQTLLAMAYQDGLICVWDLALATTAPKQVIDGVTTHERPTTASGVVYEEYPSMLVVVRVPEPLSDMAMVDDYILTTSTSGTVRVYNVASGNLLCTIPEAGAGQVVVVSEVPFIFVTGNELNNQLRVWKLATTSPMRFTLIENFAFGNLPLPAGHPGLIIPFRLLRQSSRNMIIVSHPALSALWVIPVTGGNPLTFGTVSPFTSLSTFDPSQGFIGLCEMTAVAVQFSNVPTESIAIVPANLDKLGVSKGAVYTPIKPSPLASSTSSNTESIATTLPLPTALNTQVTTMAAPVEPSISLEALKIILDKQNEACMEGLRQMRQLTLKKQAHVIKCLKDLPSAIISSITPVLEAYIETQKKNTDVGNIAANVADCTREPAGQAMGSYFRDALLPGYSKACGQMTQDVFEVVDSASAHLTNQLLPIHTANVITPIVNGLAQATNKLTLTYRDVQQHGVQAVQPAKESKSAAPPTPSKSTASSTTVSTTTSASASSSTASIPPTSVPASKAAVSQPSIVASSSSPALPAVTPKKQKKPASVSSPAPAPASVPAPASITTPAPIQKAPSPPIADLPPRPEPLVPAPLNDATRQAIAASLSQKHIPEAIKLVLDSGLVEAFGFLLSRIDLAQYIDNIGPNEKQALLILIIDQTPWPSPAQVTKYGKAVNLILSKVSASQLTMQNPSELLEQAKEWTTGTSFETTSHAAIASLRTSLGAL